MYCNNCFQMSLGHLGCHEAPWMHSVCLVCDTWCFLGVACVPHGRPWVSHVCPPGQNYYVRTCMVPPPGLIIHDPLSMRFFLNEFAYVRTWFIIHDFASSIHPSWFLILECSPTYVRTVMFTRTYVRTPWLIIDDSSFMIRPTWFIMNGYSCTNHIPRFIINDSSLMARLHDSASMIPHPYVVVLNSFPRSSLIHDSSSLMPLWVNTWFHCLGSRAGIIKCVRTCVRTYLNPYISPIS